MKFTEWSNGTPPSSGWWNTSTDGTRDPDCRRYWNGRYWSAPVFVGDSDASAIYAQAARGESQKGVEWRGRAAVWETVATPSSEGMRYEARRGPSDLDIDPHANPSDPTFKGVVKDTNPKDAAAVGRVPLHMVPDTLVLFAAIGFAEGDSKYIAYNFRVAGVRASVYISALGRHFMRYKNGEWADKKTKVPHLASMASCLSILIDGHVTGLMNDDRSPPLDLDAEFARAEEIIKHVYELNRAVRPVGVEYTIKTHPAKAAA